MENATKALLIAAAILVAIVIISIGMVVLNQGSGTSEKAGAAMSDTEKSQFNATFTNYCGNNVNGSQLMELLKKIKASNEDENDTGEGRFVQLVVEAAEDSSLASGQAKSYGGDGVYDAIELPDKQFAKSISFIVKVTKEYNSGVVRVITAKEKTR